MNTSPITSSRLSPSRSLAYETLIRKTRKNIADLATQPTTWSFDPGGDFSKWGEGFFEIGNWTTSFFTGMALIGWNETEDEHFISSVLALDPLYQKKVGEFAAETMHDLGFLYSLHSVALHKLTGEDRHRELGLKAAGVLANRFVPEGNYIRAWGRMDEPDTDYAGLAIIDCMMNLPLLYWATQKTGDSRFREIAIRHSDTTLATFIREDDSVFHAHRFDLVTGAPTRGDNYCGYGIDSHWARGTAWAIYGFAMGYRHTGDERYLDASLRIARKFISLLDDEIVPVWDFILPDDPALHIRDSSAASIAVCGFQELEMLGKAGAVISAAKNALLDRLCSPGYLDTDPAVRGTLKHGQVGMAVKAYTSWGDYYLMEALARENGMNITWW
ncbi:MAG: glycoside hydrolase family 88 protein [Luteolibacter sp.]|uniref:glycoside hydrolase family 88 protein n=1 Tax=Luteolibacter sp. TaxID=1962973 RepID=UPI00326493E2